MPIVTLIIGAALLFFGRRVFWLFVAGAGFLAGLALANRLFPESEAVGVIIGIGIGLLAALLAIFLQRFAIWLAGFLVGGYIAWQILPMLNLDAGWTTQLVAFIIGGVIGVILVGMFLDWALISLSTLAGASLVIEALSLSGGIGLVAFIVLIVIGITYQARELHRDRKKR